jgi:hypothetical protein
MRAEVTVLRNMRLQENADQLKRGNPAMKKADIAKAVIASEDFGGMNEATVARLIRVPNKVRRKKSARSP